jgi:hypothetical protein
VALPIEASPPRQPTGAAGWVANVLTWAGSLLVLGSSVIHLALWANYGYKQIPTIGPLFFIQAVVGVVLALCAGISRHWFLVWAEAGFMLASAGGLIISVNFGLFGWTETMNAPFAGLALSIELISAALLLVAGAIVVQPPLRAWSRRPDREARGAAAAS